jgi:hypothetical protein
VVPLGDTTEFDNLLLRHLHERELSVGGVGPLRGRGDSKHHKVYTMPKISSCMRPFYRSQVVWVGLPPLVCGAEARMVGPGLGVGKGGPVKQFTAARRRP